MKTLSTGIKKLLGVQIIADTLTVAEIKNIFIIRMTTLKIKTPKIWRNMKKSRKATYSYLCLSKESLTATEIFSFDILVYKKNRNKNTKDNRIM